MRWGRIGPEFDDRIASSKVGSLKQPQSAFKQVLAKLRARFSTLRLKAKKTKSPATGGQLAPIATDPPAEKFGHPTRVIFLPDVYYGWEHVAKISARSITELFGCPSRLPGTGSEYPDLAEFIAYALFICQFELEVNEHAMYLLWRLKAKHPDLKLAHGHGMYLAALNLAARMAGHDDCSSESWTMIGQWIFNSEKFDVNQRRLCELLAWKFEVDPAEMAIVMEHIHQGEQSAVGPIPLPFDYDDCAESIRSIGTSSSLSTCSIPSIWSLSSMRGWDELAHRDSAIMTASGENVNTNPYYASFDK
ncbi:unnamed protein product [Rhizoctonia solani]|uniref:Cyclin N-terminal domain-containing protein n=1 Tax=Rhizoctonia solani TaxID=456999 RepID=A0A8H3E464_9AGAM|nr:unnamed protein product [Rhizoctonia solani]